MYILDVLTFNILSFFSVLLVILFSIGIFFLAVYIRAFIVYLVSKQAIKFMYNDSYFKLLKECERKEFIECFYSELDKYKDKDKNI